MELDRATLRSLIAESLTAPRSAARRVLAVGGDYPLAVLAVGSVAALAAIVAVLLSMMSPRTGNSEMDYLVTQPLLLAALQAMGMVVFAMIATAVGRLFGGTGRLAQIMLIFAWLNFLLLVLQLGLLIVMLALPSLGPILLMAIMGLVTWLLASFIAEVHGFASTFATGAVMIGGMMIIGTLLVLISPPV